MLSSPKLLTLTAWAALLLVSAPARAEESASPPWEFRTPTGKLTGNADAYTQPIIGQATNLYRWDGEFEQTLTNTEYSLRATPWVWVRAPDTIGGTSKSVRPYFEVKEGWIDRVSPNWDIRVGNQIFAWGTADQINPTDIWNPRDLFDPFASPKLPISAAQLKIHPTQIESMSLEVIYTPFFRPSRLPISFPDTGTGTFTLSDSRWLLPFPNGVSSSGATAPLQYSITPATYPETWELGARLKLMRVGGWDFSISGWSGVESIARFAFTTKGNPTDPSLPISVTLNPSFHREQMYGFDGAGSISFGEMDIGTRFEMAYYRRDNSRAYSAPVALQADLLRDDDFEGVIGGDYTFKRNIFGTVVYINLQFVDFQRVGHLEQQPGQAVIQGLPDAQPWDRDLVVYLEDRIGTKIKFGGTFVTSFVNQDSLIEPQIQYSWTDNFKTTLSGTVFVGNKAGFFGQFSDDNRVTLNASYVF